MTAPAVALDGVVKRFARGAAPALDGITASAQAGRITGLVGPDAAGKTTLLRLIAGLLAPDAGTLRLAGGADPNVPGTLGYMPQAFGLYEDLTVAENLALYADLQSLAPGERGERARRLFEFTGLGPFRRRLAGKLSGGMKQKLGLACVLLRAPRVLLLDEPSVGVDPISRRDLWTMVRELADAGMAVLWATAYLDEAGQCDRVWMLDRGRLIQDGTPDTFLDPVRERCRAMPLPAQGRRASRAAALAAPGVLDAQIQGRTLRLLLTAHGEAPDAADVGAAVVTGHTGRYAGCSLPWVGAATAMAVGDPDRVVRPDGARPGDRLVVTEGPAVETAALLAWLFPDRVAEATTQETVDRAQDLIGRATPVRDALLVAAAGPVTAMHDATERGLANALWETTEAAGVGVELERAAVPLDSTVKRVCAAFDVDPWASASSGTLLAAVPPAGVDAVLDALATEGIAAADVGEFVAEPGVRVDGDPLSRPERDGFTAVYESLAE